ncbi:MAG: PAS domain-containing protein [Alkalilacustris sp.]
MDDLRPVTGGSEAPRGRWAGVIDLLVRRGGMVKDPGLSSLRAYWEALRGDDLIPRRAQIDPRGIENALGIAFLAERVAPEVARFRVAGMRVNGLMGMEVRGMPISALLEPESRAQFGRTLRRVLDGPAVAEISIMGSAGFGRPRLDGRMLLMPLRAEDGSITRLLGGLALEGRIGATPRRLEITGLQLTPLAPGAAQPVEEPGPDLTALPGFAEARAGFAPRPSGPPKLRVIRNDD